MDVCDGQEKKGFRYLFGKATKAEAKGKFINFLHSLQALRLNFMFSFFALICVANFRSRIEDVSQPTETFRDLFFRCRLIGGKYRRTLVNRLIETRSRKEHKGSNVH